MTHGTQIEDSTRWLVLLVTCLGVLMIVMDATIVNVALPTIRNDLGFSESSLVWVVSAYMVPYASFLLLFGRLADHYGKLRLFLLGIVCFTLASLICGIAGTAGVLIAARAVQGVGGAAVLAVSYSLVMQQFDGRAEKGRAVAIYSGVGACGSSAGVVLGGILTHALSWRWIFFVNLPIGVIVYLLCALRQARVDLISRTGRPDIEGALTITASLALVVLAMLNAVKSGWNSASTLVPLGTALVCIALFVAIEMRAEVPIVPISLFRQRNLSLGALAGALWAAAAAGCAFVCALYLQAGLGYDPMQVGLAFLPANLCAAAFALSLSNRLVVRFGIRVPLIGGLLCVFAAMVFFSLAPAHASFVADILPAMLLMGAGGGIAYNPLLLSASRGVAEGDYGVVSGILSSSQAMGAVIGLAFIIAVATMGASYLAATGASLPVGNNSSYSVAFVIAAIFTCGAALLGLYFEA